MTSEQGLRHAGQPHCRPGPPPQGKEELGCLGVIWAWAGSWPRPGQGRHGGRASQVGPALTAPVPSQSHLTGTHGPPHPVPPHPDPPSLLLWRQVVLPSMGSQLNPPPSRGPPTLPWSPPVEAEFTHLETTTTW